MNIARENKIYVNSYTRIRMICVTTRTLYVFLILEACRRSRTRGPFAHLHHQKNLESKSLSLVPWKSPTPLRAGKDNAVRVGTTNARLRHDK